MEPKVEVDIWTRALTALERQYVAQGMTREQAEEKACNEIRRQIRDGK